MRTILLLLPFLAQGVFVAVAQNRPFLFTMEPPGKGEELLLVHYAAAYGRQTFEPLGADNVEQVLGIQAGIGESFLLLAHAGLALQDGPTRVSQQAELLARFMNGENRVIDLAAGFGYRREYGGTNVLLSRIIVGHRSGSWQLFGNLLLEKAFAADRDDFDAIVTGGFSRDFGGTVQAGFEIVGQDLEGFWDRDEAEGGATLFMGPGVHLAFPGTTCGLTVGGGLILRATQSARFSDAPRDLPVGRRNGFVLRTELAFGL